MSIRIGTSPSSRSRRHTSTPSSWGRPRSSTTASGSKRPDSLEGGLAVPGHPHLVTLSVERAAQHAGDVGVVLHHEHPRPPAHAANGREGGAARSVECSRGWRSRRTQATRRCARRRVPPGLKLPQLEQRHLDLIGLGAGVLRRVLRLRLLSRLGRGRGGGGAWRTAILLLFGGVGYAAPVGALGRGRRGDAAADAARRASVRAGALCLFAALTLGLAAGSLGLGPGDTAARRLPRRRIPARPRRSRGRVASLGVQPPLLPRRRAHPVRLPPAGRRAAAHGRVGRRAC